MLGEAFWGALLVKGWAVFCALVGSAVAAFFLKPASKLQAMYLVMGNFLLSVVVAPAFIATFMSNLPGSDPRTGAVYCLFGLVGMVVCPIFMKVVQGAAEKILNDWLGRFWK